MRRRSCGREKRGSSGVEFASFGLMLIRSQTTGSKTVPAVSTVMWRFCCRNRSVRAMMSGAIIGSPPVTTTWRAGWARTSSRIWSSVSSVPSGCQEVYGVSHQEQRKLQPLVRMKIEGTPISAPSP